MQVEHLFACWLGPQVEMILPYPAIEVGFLVCGSLNLITVWSLISVVVEF